MGRAYYLWAISLEAEARESHSLPASIEEIYNAYGGACFYFRLNREGINKIKAELKPRIEFLEMETKIKSNIFNYLNSNFSDQESYTHQYADSKGLFPSHNVTIDDHFSLLLPNI